MVLDTAVIPQTHFHAGAIGLGLMGLTWRPVQTPDDQAFKTMKAALEQGSNVFNGGEFYGTPEPTLNLQLLNRYFTKYPEDAEKIFLSIKGGVRLAGTRDVDGSPDAIRASVENIVKILGPNKPLDLYECARVPPNVPIEETIKSISVLIKEGKVKYIGLSEASAETIRRAHAVHPISCVEIEYSIWATEAEANGVLDTCKELDIAVISYSPLGRGYLTGTIQKAEDIPEGDMRRHFDRFQKENFDKNLAFVEIVKKIADRHKSTPAQVALAWILKQAENRKQIIIPIPGSTSPERCLENIAAANVKLTAEDDHEIRELINTVVPVGSRYNKQLEFSLYR